MHKFKTSFECISFFHLLFLLQKGSDVAERMQISALLEFWGFQSHLHLLTLRPSVKLPQPYLYNECCLFFLVECSRLNLEGPRLQKMNEYNEWISVTIYFSFFYLVIGPSILFIECKQSTVFGDIHINFLLFTICMNCLWTANSSCVALGSMDVTQSCPRDKGRWAEREG